MQFFEVILILCLLFFEKWNREFKSLSKMCTFEQILESDHPTEKLLCEIVTFEICLKSILGIDVLKVKNISGRIQFVQLNFLQLFISRVITNCILSFR